MADLAYCPECGRSYDREVHPKGSPCCTERFWWGKTEYGRRWHYMVDNLDGTSTSHCLASFDGGAMIEMRSIEDPPPEDEQCRGCLAAL